VAKVEPPPPPLPPPKWFIDVNVEATRGVEAAAAARAKAVGPTVFGPPLHAIKTELLISVQHQHAERAKIEEAAATYYQQAEARKAALAAEQAAATALLKEQGLL
jgi:hypothetical protein